MRKITITVDDVTVALRKESVDRNFGRRKRKLILIMSLSARRAWIEILFHAACFALPEVALRKESVDRNVCRYGAYSAVGSVALRKESVDRNVNLRVLDGSRSSSLSARRAWIEIEGKLDADLWVMSLSARRAWIEIIMPDSSAPGAGSLSARRAWIEIHYEGNTSDTYPSLSARRAWIEINLSMSCSAEKSCRSPQGERG